MAFENTSDPGIITLSPRCKPETEETIAVSRVVMPVTLIDRMVYSFGTFAVCRARRSGSTEVTPEVSTCAKEIVVKRQRAETKSRDRYRCMMIDSVNKAIGKRSLERQINGKFQTVLLKKG